MFSQKTTSRRLPVVLPLQDDAYRMGLKVLSTDAVTVSEPNRVLGVSPLISYMVQDANYAISPAAMRRDRKKLSPLEKQEVAVVDQEITRVADRMRRWDNEVKEDDKVAATTSQTLQRLVTKLKKQVDFWRDKFRAEARIRASVFELHDKLKRERLTSTTEKAQLQAVAAKTIIMLRSELKGLKKDHAAVTSEAQQWRLRYNSVAHLGLSPPGS